MRITIEKILTNGERGRCIALSLILLCAQHACAPKRVEKDDEERETNHDEWLRLLVKLSFYRLHIYIYAQLMCFLHEQRKNPLAYASGVAVQSIRSCFLSHRSTMMPVGVVRCSSVLER